MTEVLRRGGFGADEADLEAIARLMLVAHVSSRAGAKPLSSALSPALASRRLEPSQLLHARQPARQRCHSPRAPRPPRSLAPWQGRMWGRPVLEGLAALGAIQRPLFESATSLDRQLAALHQRCGGGGRNSGTGSDFPTVTQLQAAWAVLVIDLALAGKSQALPEAKAELAALAERAAHILLALQPDNPRSSYELGCCRARDVFSVVTPSASAMRLHNTLLHFWHGAALARAQGSDFWLARWGGLGAECWQVQSA